MTSNVIPTPFGTFSLPFPWATPAVDVLICALDTRNVGIPEIVRRVKKQFPSLAECAIPFAAVEKRILILDQNVHLDYFKPGLGLGSRKVEHGVGSSKAIKHGVAIHARTGEPWEKAGVSTGRPGPPKDSLRGDKSARGARSANAAPRDQREPQEVMNKMQGLGREKSLRKVHPHAASKMEDLLPRPLSPCRSDEHGRPMAVDHSLRKLRSLEIERPSVENERRRHVPEPPKMHVSPFPRIPHHQRSAANLRTVEPTPKPVAPAHFIRLRKSASSLRKAPNILRKKSSRELNSRPLIHITKPSSERAKLGDEGEVPEYLHPF